MQAIKLGPEGMGSEVVLPQAWREEMDVKGGMGVHALDYLDEGIVEIDALPCAVSQIFSVLLTFCDHLGDCFLARCPGWELEPHTDLYSICVWITRCADGAAGPIKPYGSIGLVEKIAGEQEYFPPLCFDSHPQIDQGIARFFQGVGDIVEQ